MIPDSDSPQRQARYLILDPIQAARNMVQFKDAIYLPNDVVPSQWVSRAHGMTHLLQMIAHGDERPEKLERICLLDILDVLGELERFSEPNNALDAILPRKGVIHDGGNGYT